MIANKTIGFVLKYAAKELALRNIRFLEPARVASMPFVYLLFLLCMTLRTVLLQITFCAIVYEFED